MKAILAFALLTQAAFGGVVLQVSMDTSPLIGNAAGPFQLDFQFTDGSGTSDGNNTVTVSGFNFGAGAASGTAIVSGGASGDLSSTVTLIDNSFFNELTQGFTPGATLSFTLSMTTNVDPGVPDEFSFAIFDNSGFEIPTLGPGDAFLVSDISSANPAAQLFASDTSRNAAAGVPIDLSAPAVQAPAAGVPEPSMLTIVALALGAIFLVRRR